MYVIFSVNEQKGKMQGFVMNENDDNIAHFKTLKEAKKWCENDPFAPAKTRYIFNMRYRSIIWTG
jgi:hypothetical protein